MIFDDIRTLRTVNEALDPNCIKIFLYLVFHQPQEGIRGYIIDKKQLNYDLNLSRTKFFKAMRWLKENIVVNELKMVGYSDFMVNPYIVMNNGDRDARIAEWSRRIKLQDDKDKKNRERKRKSELRKQNK